MANPTTIIKNDSNAIVDLVPSTTATANGVGPTLVGVEAFPGITVFLNITAASGTTPTLKVILQKLLSDSTTWMDIAAFASFAATGKQTLDFVSGVPSTTPSTGQLNTPTDGTMAVSTVLTTMLGGTIRIKYVIGGTNPSFTFQVSAELIRRLK